MQILSGVFISQLSSLDDITSLCRYRPRDAQMNSETFHYKRGANQVFSQSLHVIDPTKFPEEDVRYLFTICIYYFIFHVCKLLFVSSFSIDVPTLSLIF